MPSKHLERKVRQHLEPADFHEPTVILRLWRVAVKRRQVPNHRGSLLRWFTAWHYARTTDDPVGSPPRRLESDGQRIRYWIAATALDRWPGRDRDEEAALRLLRKMGWGTDPHKGRPGFRPSLEEPVLLAELLPRIEPHGKP